MSPWKRAAEREAESREKERGGRPGAKRQTGVGWGNVRKERKREGRREGG